MSKWSAALIVDLLGITCGGGGGGGDGGSVGGVDVIVGIRRVV